MNKIALGFGCGLVLFLIGCVFGDPIAHRIVSVNFPEIGGLNQVSLSVQDPEVQEALRIIDNVLFSQGFHRDPHILPAEEQRRGLVAFYGICGVSLAQHRMEIGFTEAYRRRSSARVRRVSNLLKEKLAERYGHDRVTVDL